jgi:hypothetical protein
MRFLLAIVFAVAAVHTATAFDCAIGTEGKLVPLSWSATAKDAEWTSISVEIRNDYEKDILIGIVRPVFVGATTGEESYGMMVVQNTDAGATTTRVMDADSMKYLVNADRNAVDLHLCVQNIQFADGTRSQ